jgi:1-acyl-sn-glycerol-3-phosphate acyltransferase
MKLIIYQIAKFFVWLYLHAIFRFQVQGRHYIPRRGGVLLAANHVSAYDPPVVGSVIPRPAYFLAKKELFDNPIKNLIMSLARCIPVDRADIGRGTLKRINDLLQRGQAVLMFPEGTRSRSGEINSAKDGVGMIAAHNKVDVVPVHVAGLYKVRGSIFRRPRIFISFGEAVPVASLLAETQQPRREIYRAITAAVFERIRELGNGAASVPHPHYSS